MSDIRERFTREQGPGGLEARGYAVEARAADDAGPHISGIGSPYGQVARIQGWFDEWDEVVAEGAARNTITRDGADIVSTYNHNLDNLLARTTADTLTLDDPPEGLTYDASINQADSNAMSVYAKVSRGDVSGASIWFRVIKDQWEEPTEDNDLEVPLRTILEYELFEVGPVAMPAFPQTTAEAASFRQLGYKPELLSAMDGSLRAAGITRNASRAAYAFRFLADPESEIRELFSQDPDLRERVCDSDPATAAAKSAPRSQVSLQLNEELYAQFE